MYRAPWSRGIEDDYALFGSYDFPVFSPRLRANVNAGYSQFDITPEGGKDVGFLGNGSFWGGGLSYNVLQVDNWFLDVTGSMSRERSKVTPELGLSSDVDMDLWGIGLHLHHRDKMSNTSVSWARSASMGGSSYDEFQLARLDTDPDFAIYNFAASHGRYLDEGRVHRLSGYFQWIDSDERLVPSKMTTFGGLNSVRGYKEYETVADGGIKVSGQYEFDLVKHWQVGENEEDDSKKPWVRKLAPLCFIDYGRAVVKDPVVGEQRVTEMCSVGIGTIMELGENVSTGIYYGWALRGTDETDRGEGRLGLSFMIRW
jgi:hemolysin activation/secretion protein